MYQNLFTSESRSEGSLISSSSPTLSKLASQNSLTHSDFQALTHLCSQFRGFRVQSKAGVAVQGSHRIEKQSLRNPCQGHLQDQNHQASTTALLKTISMETGGPCLLFTVGMGVNKTAGPRILAPHGECGTKTPIPNHSCLEPWQNPVKNNCPSPRACCHAGQGHCSRAGLLFSISNLIQLFTSTAKSQCKLILQRARLCKLCCSSNINSMILAYNFSNLMFSWPRVNPSNWRWKQLQKV